MIGGDWYDAFELDDGRLIVRQAIRGAAEVAPDPVAIVNAADRTFAKTHPDGLVTAFLGIIDPLSGTIAYASAGHPPPFVRRPDETIDRLGGHGLPLGLRGEGPLEATSVAGRDDDALLVLYTDGLTEAGRDVEAGEGRLADALAATARSESPAQDLRHRVLGDDGSIEPRDDVAILTIRRTAERHRRVTAEIRATLRAS